MVKQLISAALACTLVCASLCMAGAADLNNWDGGPPVLIDDEDTPYADVDAGLLLGDNAAPIFMRERGEYDPVAVLCGERLIGSAFWFVGASYGNKYDFSRPREKTSYDWWVGAESAHGFPLYPEDAAVITPLAGVPGRYWKSQIEFLQPGQPILRMDYREWDDNGSVRSPCFAPSLVVYDLEGEPTLGETGQSIALRAHYLEQQKDGALKSVVLGSVPGLADCEFAYTVENAAHPDGSAFTAAEIASAQTEIAVRDGIGYLAPTRPGTYAVQLDVSNRPGTSPADIRVTVSGEELAPSSPPAEIEPDAYTPITPVQPFSGITAVDAFAYLKTPAGAAILDGGTPVGDDTVIGTGMVLRIPGADNTTICIRGDVTSSGVMSVTQLVRLAQAVSG